MAAAYPKRINNIIAGLMLAMAAIFDGLQFLLTLTVVGSIASPLVTFLALCIFGVWFLIHGINYIGGRKAGIKLASTIGAAVTELVPLINGLPAITLGVLGVIYASRKEDEENAEEARKASQQQAHAATIRQAQLARARARAVIVQFKNSSQALSNSQDLRQGPPDPVNVKEIMKRTDSFFVHTFPETHMQRLVPGLMDTPHERSVSASTIRPGKSLLGRVSGTYDSSGVILRDGTVTAFDTDDLMSEYKSVDGEFAQIADLASPRGMSSSAFSRRGRQAEGLRKLDKVAVQRRQGPKKRLNSSAYNELIVRQPRAYGYFESLSPNKHGAYSLKNQDLESFRVRFKESKRLGLPMFVLSPERNFLEVKGVGPDGTLELGRKLTPDQVYG